MILPNRNRLGSGLLVSLLALVSLTWGCGDSNETITTPGTTQPAAIVIFPNVQIFDEVGQSLQFSVRVQDQYGFSVTWVPVTWETSDPSVVTVTDTGLVTAVSKGEAEVRVVAQEGTLKATSRITVQ